MNLSLFIGLRYCGAQKRSRSVSFLSGVSIVGLTVGVSLLVLVLSVMNGFDREMKNRILGLVPQAAIFHRLAIEDWVSLKNEVEGISGVVAASPFVKLHGLVNYRNNTSSVLVYGIEPSAEKDVSLINNYISDNAQKRLSSGERVILLGKGIADKLELQVGDSLMLVVPGAGISARSAQVEYFELAGILHSKTELDSTLALTGLRQAARLQGDESSVSGLRLKLEDLFDAPRLMYQVNMQLGPDYYSSNWTRTHWNLYQAIQMSKNLVGLLMSLIVAIAAFNVVSTLVLLVIDKQGDIAILRTMGVTGRQILAIFVMQGGFIGLLGTVFGIGIGCLMALGIENAVSFIESVFGIQFLKSDVYPLTYLPTEIRFSDILSVGVTGFVMSLLATIYPAWKATRVQPAVALRYE